MEAKETFLSYLNALDDDYYFFLATVVLGKVQTPYHKPVLSNKIMAFLMNRENRDNMLSSLDRTDLRYISLCLMIGDCTLWDIHEFFPYDTYTLVLTRMDSLCDRLVMLRDDKVYRVNPVLREDLDSLFDPSLLFEEDRKPHRELPFVTRNILFAMLNLLTNGSVPVREANAHHFTKTDKLDRVFPQVSKTTAVKTYEALKALALSTRAVTISAGRFIIDPARAMELARLDSLNLMLEALRNRVTLPPKLFGMEIGDACTRLLGILKGHSVSIIQAKALLAIFLGMSRSKDSVRSKEAIEDILELMGFFGFITMGTKTVRLNQAVLKPDLERSAINVDSNLALSYYGIPKYDDILYLFSDIQVCDKMISYVLTKDSFTRALGIGLTQERIMEYLGTDKLKAQMDQWSDSYSRVTLYDGIILKCDEYISPIVMMHPQLQEHIVRKIDDGIFLMRRSTFQTWQSVLSYAMDMQRLPLPISETGELGQAPIADSSGLSIEDVLPAPKEEIQTRAWEDIEAELLDYAQETGCLSDDVKDLIKAKLIVSKDQIGKCFKYVSMPTISGFDFNAKIGAIRNALKGKSSLMRLELPDETIIVKPIEVSKGDARNSVLKVEVLPNGLERNIPVSSIFRITVLRWSIN